MINFTRLIYITSGLLVGLTFPINAQQYCKANSCSKYSEIYAGAIGYGTTLEVGNSGVGLDDYFGSGDADDIKGGQWGAVVGYTYRKPCGIYFNTEFDWAVGSLTSDSDYIGNIPNQCLHSYLVTGRFGYNFKYKNCLLLTPYGGLGYRYIQENIHHSKLKANFSNYFGIVGGRVDWQMNRCFMIGFDGQWFIPIHTRLRLKEFCGSMNVNGGSGYQLELPMKYTLPRYCKNIAITFAPFYRRISYGDSKFYTFGIQTIKVPKLIFKDYGAKLYFDYLF